MVSMKNDLLVIDNGIGAKKKKSIDVTSVCIYNHQNKYSHFST